MSLATGYHGNLEKSTLTQTIVEVVLLPNLIEHWILNHAKNHQKIISINGKLCNNVPTYCTKVTLGSLYSFYFPTQEDADVPLPWL